MIYSAIFKVIEKISPFLIVTPTVESFGNCAEEMQHALIRALNEGKKAIFIFPLDMFFFCRFSKNSLGVNQSLTDINSNFLYKTNAFFIYPLRLLMSIEYCIYRLFNKFIQNKRIATNPRYGINEIYNIGNESIYSTEILRTKSWDLALVDDIGVHLGGIVNRRALQGKRDLGIPDDAWFVCVHVRDGGYYGSSEGLQKQTRNSDILNYCKAFKTITQSGGWVVRIGDSNMKKIPDLDHVIDYAHSKEKSDLLDVYLIQECAFYIGTPSGPLTVANLFRRPILLTNMYEHFIDYPMRSGDLGIMKKFFSKSKERNLSLTEQLTIQDKSDQLIYKSDDILLVENDENEIDDLVSEFINSSNVKQTNLQKDWEKARVNSGFRYYEKLCKNNSISLAQVYRFSSRIISYKGNLPNNFVASNL
ncbi:TIGR04372 family glycosyltransferase [Candidatus Thioglobus autotrophicus]|uniref:TIGR04372 family glycosyltransferase n=1 Tax=Candidatus Thioglobus autotrophicus TaxID=1705394 RepID=UPI00299E1408|nr:TIGR04372 family glycosyltransferase [Candidatus Thioglobus autotrophicus]WPE17760.1 TIGR04372 family glycosyltransferase [Candidatus Thioglobus autotrophicus]